MKNISSPARVRLGARKGESEVDEALKQVLFCVKHQSPGYILVQTLIPTKSGGHTPDKSFWFDNQAPDLKNELRARLTKLIGLRRMVLYTPCSYSKKHAKAEFALPSALAFVDADAGVDISKVPHPSRIVASSVLGRHWFWKLTKKVPPKDGVGNY